MGLVLQGVVIEICVSQMYFANLIPSESATYVFFSNILYNNFRANYLLFFSKLSNPLRKLIPSKCECLWLSGWVEGKRARTLLQEEKLAFYY